MLQMAISAYILKIAEMDPFLRLQMRVKEELEKLWLFNHRRADFLASKFWNIFHFSASLKCSPGMKNEAVS